MIKRRGFLILMGVWGLAAATQANPGTLKPVKGSVYIQHPNKNLWDAVQAPTAVDEGDRIKTNNDSDAFLILPDDHRVAIGPETYVVLQRMAEGETKIYLKNGTIRNKVRHLQVELGQYYKVQTPTTVCAVRGTDFMVMQNPSLKTSEVHVFEGMVDMSSLKADIAHTVTHLEAGHSAAMDAGGNVQHTAPAGNPAPPQGNPLPGQHGKDEGTGPANKGPMPPGSGGATPPMPGGNGPTNGGPNWYDHPEGINPTTFKPVSGLPPTMMPPTGGTVAMLPPTGTAEGGTTAPTVPPNQPPSSFDPLSGTGIQPGPGSGGPGSSYPTNGSPGGPTTVTYNPLPTGNNPTSTSGSGTDPASLGNQALFATIQNMNLQSQLQGLLVAGLFQDGSVKLSPIDHQWHLYADSIQQAPNNGVQFYNATQIYGQPNTLNYQIATINFNAPLPPTASAFAIATQTAFHGYNPTAPANSVGSYFATSIDNYRSNTFDYVDVLASASTGVLPVLNPATNRYDTVFDNGKCTVNGTVLWTENSGTYSFLGGSAPSLNPSGGGNASIGWNNIYNVPGPNGQNIYLGRQVAYIDTNSGQIASGSSMPTTMSPAQYFGGTALVAQDTLYSNLFTHGSIMSFASSQSRLLGGIDSILNDTDALSILNGGMPGGIPDGLITSSGQLHT